MSGEPTLSASRLERRREHLVHELTLLQQAPAGRRRPSAPRPIRAEQRRRSDRLTRLVTTAVVVLAVPVAIVLAAAPTGRGDSPLRAEAPAPAPEVVGCSGRPATAVPAECVLDLLRPSGVRDLPPAPAQWRRQSEPDDGGAGPLVGNRPGARTSDR